MQHKIIGGEIEFDFNAEIRPRLNRLNDYGSYFASGRSALFSILQALGKRNIKRILLPDYLCSSIVTTVAASQLQYDFYKLEDSLLPDIQDIKHRIDESTAMLFINYFGMQNLSASVSAVRELAAEAPVLIDDVQALFCFIKSETTDADYTFTSLRKWLGVPDGGLARSKTNDIDTPDTTNCFWIKKLNGISLKSMRDSLRDMDEIYLHLLEEGENMIDDSLTQGGSEVTSMVFERTDLDAIATKRRQNASHILSGLKDLGIAPIITHDAKSVPFFIPIVLENRDLVRKLLFSQNIFCPVHWPLDGLILERGTFMAAHELSIIIDQRYSTDDMDRILSVLEKSVRLQ